MGKITPLMQKALTLTMLKFGMVIDTDKHGEPVFDFSKMDKEGWELRGKMELKRVYTMLKAESLSKRNK